MVDVSNVEIDAYAYLRTELTVQYLNGRYGDCLARCNAVLGHESEVLDDNRQRFIWGLMAWCLYWRGEWEEATTMARQAAQDSETPHIEALNCELMIAAGTGDPDRTHELADELGWSVHTHTARIILATETGNADAYTSSGMQMEFTGLATNGDGSTPQELGSLCYSVARFYHQRGDSSDAHIALGWANISLGYHEDSEFHSRATVYMLLVSLYGEMELPGHQYDTLVRAANAWQLSLRQDPTNERFREQRDKSCEMLDSMH